jgi:hypothetical protein
MGKEDNWNEEEDWVAFIRVLISANFCTLKKINLENSLSNNKYLEFISKGIKKGIELAAEY